MTRRIVFVLGILPVLIYSFLRWVVTGKDVEDVIAPFIEWGGA